MQELMTTVWLPLSVLAALALAFGLWWLRQRSDAAAGKDDEGPAWALANGGLRSAEGAGQPQPVLVLGSVERQAFRLLRDAFPRAEILSHVPLLRFIRMPPHEQRARWLEGVGALDADLLLCDGRFRVLAAIDVRTRRDTASAKQRNERMARVLQAAGIAVHVWHEESLPTVAEIRKSMAPALAARKAAKAKQLGLALPPPADDAAAPDSRPAAPAAQAAGGTQPAQGSASSPLPAQPAPTPERKLEAAGPPAADHRPEISRLATRRPVSASPGTAGPAVAGDVAVDVAVEAVRASLPEAPSGITLAAAGPEPAPVPPRQATVWPRTDFSVSVQTTVERAANLARQIQA